jgi:hypothetical protein
VGSTSPARATGALVLASIIGALVLSGPLEAGTAHLVEGSGPDRVVVEASEATTDEILAALARHFEFAVERGGSTSQPVRISGRLQGSLDEVLQRLLRHEGHMIVRSAEARAGISRVLILPAKGGAPALAAPGTPAPTTGAPPLPNPIAALKARLQGREQEPGK